MRRLLDTLTTEAVQTLRAAFGIGPDAAAEMLIVAGDNPSRIRSDAAFAKLCGACPIEADIDPVSAAACGSFQRVLTYRGVNALAESINGLFKTEVIHHAGPWKGLDNVELAALE